MLQKFKQLLSYLGEYKKYAILTPLVMVGEAAMEILIPFLMARMLTYGVKAQNTEYTVKIGIIMIVASIFSLACGALGGRFSAKAGIGFGKNIRAKLFERVQDFSFANVDRYSTASLITRLTTDVTNVQNTFMMCIRMLVRSPSMLIGAFIMAITINAKMAVVFAVVIPILAIALGLIASNAHPRFTKMLERYDKMNAALQENLIAIRVVKAFVRERHEIDKFEASADEVRKTQVAAEKIVLLNAPVMQLCMYGCILAILWFGGRMSILGTFDIGELSGFISYIGQILMSLMMITMIFISLIISMASVRRICEVLDETVDISDDHADPTLTLADGSVVFRNVSFSYNKDSENPNLEEIDLTIRSGETIGIIGGTGSAKSTLVQLIPRLYDVTEGSVLVGGHDVRDYKLNVLRDQVAMVLQKNVLFSGTIRENLLWGNPDATEEQIVEACKAAQAHDFIMSFPHGYDTELGQGGTNVSGGQKQRLCIARALLKKPKIMILDDSTSAVDTATDSKIRDALQQYHSDITTIIIAQRISSVAEADRILVMDEGKCNAFDTHENLLRENAIYREVYESQQKGAE
ncbi:MAG: ABC transporter ATP-binding protein [Oscillospiraceae bacterium]|nr:ABC transporter ATP-binding protein [Oscillospiraceae bacterium]